MLHRSLYLLGFLLHSSLIQRLYVTIACYLCPKQWERQRLIRMYLALPPERQRHLANKVRVALATRTPMNAECEPAPESACWLSSR